METKTKISHNFFTPSLKKYEISGKFPWKLIIHVLLTISCTSQVLLTVNRSTQYSYNQYILWNKYFLNENASGSDEKVTNSFNIFGISSLKAFLHQKVDFYYNINNIAIANYEYDYLNNGDKKSPELLIEYFNNKKALNQGLLLTYHLTPSDLGPFSSPHLKDFLEQVKTFEISYFLTHKLNNHIHLSSSCYNWKIIQRFNFQFHGIVDVKLVIRSDDCFSEDNNFLKNFYWVDISVVVLACSSLFLIGKYFYKRLEFFSELSGSKSFSSVWKDLPISTKMTFFNFWTIITMISNFLQVLGAVVSIMNRSKTDEKYFVFVGFGCFFSWINLIQYLDRNGFSYALIRIATRSCKPIFFYMVGFLPVFFGYSFLAMCSFWQLGVFSSTSMAFLANYAVVYGDSLYSFSLAAMKESCLLGQVYYYSYALFFISFVHKIFIAIIEKEYLESKGLKGRLLAIEDGWEIQDLEQKSKEEKKRKFTLGSVFRKRKKTLSLNFNENSITQIQKMDDIVEKILKNLKNLKNFSESGDEVIKTHLLSLINSDFFPLLQNFK